jgi:ABC-type transport system involved in multi-copper enzyme maturation permease subunit
MGLIDFGYRHYGRERTGITLRVRAMVNLQIRRFFGKKLSLLFFFACLFPAIIALVFIYIRFVVIEGQGELAGLQNLRGISRRNPNTLFGRSLEEISFYFTPYLTYAMPIAVIFSAIVGASTIPNDRNEGALELYFTRGLRPTHFFLGKWLGIFFLHLCLILFPYLLVWIIGVFLAPDWNFLKNTAPFIPRLVFAQSLFCGGLSFLVLAQSTSTSSSRFSVMRVVGGLFVFWVLARMLRRFFHEPNFLVISPWNVLKRVAEGIADVQASHTFDLRLALFGLLALGLLGTFWILKHLKATKAVG